MNVTHIFDRCFAENLFRTSFQRSYRVAKPCINSWVSRSLMKIPSHVDYESIKKFQAAQIICFV